MGVLCETGLFERKEPRLQRQSRWLLGSGLGLFGLGFARLGVREQFAGAFAEPTLADIPFVLQTLALSAVEFANSNFFRSALCKLALHKPP